MQQKSSDSALRYLDFTLLDMLAMQLSFLLAHNILGHEGFLYFNQVCRMQAIIYFMAQMALGIHSDSYDHIFSRDNFAEFSKLLVNVAEIWFLAGAFMILNRMPYSVTETMFICVTYLDLADGSYHGTPEDYDQIDFAAVTYCSENHLILYRDSEAAVYTKGKTEPVIIHDERFDIYGDWFAEGDYMFCSENAYNLTTKDYLHLVDMEYKPIIAERDHSYIILNLPKGECFEKIPAEQLLHEMY